MKVIKKLAAPITCPKCGSKDGCDCEPDYECDVCGQECFGAPGAIIAATMSSGGMNRYQCPKCAAHEGRFDERI